MINAEEKEEFDVNHYHIPSIITSNLKISLSTNSLETKSSSSKNSLLKSLFTNSSGFSFLKSSSSTPTINSLQENSLITQSLTMATATSAATLLPNYFNLNEASFEKQKNYDLRDSKRKKSKKKKSNDSSLSSCFKVRSASVSGLETSLLNSKEFKKSPDLISINNEASFNLKLNNMPNNIVAENDRLIKQPFSFDYHLLTNNFVVDLQSSIDDCISKFKKSNTTFNTSTKKSSQVQNLLIKKKDDHLDEQLEKATKNDVIREEKISAIVGKKGKINDIELYKKTNFKEKINEKTDELSSELASPSGSLKEREAEKRNIIVDIKVTSTAVPESAKTIEKSNEKKETNINKSADLVNHLTKRSVLSCSVEQIEKEADKSKRQFNLEASAVQVDLKRRSTNSRTLNLKVNLKSLIKSKSINDLGDSSDFKNSTKDANKKGVKSNSANQLNLVNELNSCVIKKLKSPSNQSTNTPVEQQLSTNSTNSLKLNQKFGTLNRLKTKLTKGFNSKNRIRESFCSQSKSCIEQLLLHEQCKTNANKNTFLSIKNEIKMKFRNDQTDRDYNLTKSMKTVDHKDLTLMQILALKKIRSKLKSTVDKLQDTTNLENNSKKLTETPSQQKSQLNLNKQLINSNKMVLPELDQSSPICGENAPDLIYLKKENLHSNLFTSNFMKNNSFRCDENIQKNDLIYRQYESNKFNQEQFNLKLNKNYLTINESDQLDKQLIHKCNSKTTTTINKPNKKWIQLAGHEQSFFDSNKPGVILKKNELNESLAYKKLNESNDQIVEFLPKFYSIIKNDDGQFIELQDLLTLFNNPCLMDIKMGSRTFLENDVLNSRARPDLYEKLIKIDSNAATKEEHTQKAITKLRYMTFRENLSSSSTLGFRIEGFRCRCEGMIKDFKYLRKEEDVKKVLKIFLPLNKDLRMQLLKKLKLLRSRFKESEFFKNHEVVGSSLLIIYDDHKVGVWMIDLARTVELPKGIRINHETTWNLGNHEDGYLTGLNNLISIIKEIV